MPDSRHTMHLNIYFYYKPKKHLRMNVPLFTPNRPSPMKNISFVWPICIIRMVVNTTYISIFSRHNRSVRKVLLSARYRWENGEEQSVACSVTQKLSRRGWANSGLCESKLVLLTQLQQQKEGASLSHCRVRKWQMLVDGHKLRCEGVGHRGACRRTQLTDLKYCNFTGQLLGLVWRVPV